MRQTLFKRILTGMLICALLSSLFCGCGRDDRDAFLYYSNEGGEEKTSVSFFGFKVDGINLVAIESALQKFMAEHRDIDITYEGIKGPGYWEVFEKRSAHGVLDDVFMIDHDHVIALSGQGGLADLSDLPGLENYSSAVRGQFANPDGTVYFLPTSVTTYSLYINYDLLEEHGQSIPENWEQFRACCDYFVSQGIVPIIANNYNALPTLIISRGLYDVYQQPNVEDLIQQFNEQPALLARELMPGVELVAGMVERGWLDPEEVLATAQTSDDLALFAKGERPFMISGAWASLRVMAMKPQFSYGVHPYPILEDGCVAAVQADTCIAVRADSENLEAAKQFVSYLIQPDVIWEYCDSQSSYTPLNDEKRVPSDQTLVPIAAYLTNGRISFRADYRLTLPTGKALLNCANVLLHGGSAQEAEEALEKTLSE